MVAFWLRCSALTNAAIAQRSWNWNLRGIPRHRVFAVGDRVEDLPNRLFAPARIVHVANLGPRRSVSRTLGIVHEVHCPLIHHAVAESVPAVTRCTINVETNMPVFEERNVSVRPIESGMFGRPGSIDHTIVEVGVEIGLSASNRTDNFGSHRSAVSEQRVHGLRLELRLDVHVLNDVHRPVDRDSGVARMRAITTGGTNASNRRHITMRTIARGMALFLDLLY